MPERNGKREIGLKNVKKKRKVYDNDIIVIQDMKMRHSHLIPNLILKCGF